MGFSVETAKQPSTGPAYVFGPFKLIPDERVLLRETQTVALTSKTFDLLLMLVESAGHLKTREALIEALWPDTVVEEANLSWNMRALRKALGDEGETPRYIQTIRGHGYRFIMPVTLEQPAVTESKKEKLLTSKQRWGIAAFATLAVVAVAVSLVLLWPRVSVLRRPESAPSRPAIAILGFQNLSGDRKADWIGTALTEMVGTDLAAGGELRTTPSMDVTRVRREFNLPGGGATLDRGMLRALHKNLSADYVATGAYLLLGQGGDAQLRVDVKLLDTGNGTTVAAFSETGNRSELFDLVRSLGVGLREQLGAAALTPSEESEVRATIPLSLTAARAYAEGLRALSAGDPVAARAALQQAVSIEPNFPLAYVGLTQAWMDLGDEVNARTAAHKALDNSAGLARPQRLLIDGLYREAGHEWDQAVEDYRALFTFFPDDLQYGLLLARAQVKTDEPKDALATVASLRKLSPPAGDDPRVDIAEADAADTVGNNQRAASAAARAAATAQERGATLLEALALSHLGRSENLLGHYKDALEHLNQARKLYEKVGGDILGLGITLERIGNVYFAQGDYGTAIQIYGEANDTFARIGNRYWQGAALNNIGGIYYQRNQLDEAQHYYELALPMFRDIHRDLTACYVLTNLGVINGDQGDMKGAIRYYEEAIAIRRAAGAEEKSADTLYNLSNAYVAIGEFQKALQALQEAMTLYKKNDDQPDESNVLAAFADIDVQEDRLPAAQQRYEQALAIREAKGMHKETAENKRDLAELALLTGDAPQAVKLAQAAVDEYQREKAGTDEARSRTVLGLALLGEGRNADAEVQFKAVKVLYPSIQSGYARFNLDILMARLTASLGDPTSAEKMLRQTITQTSRLGLLTLAYWARLRLAEIQAHSGMNATLRASVSRLAVDANKTGYLLVAHKAETLARKIQDLQLSKRDIPSL
jgi:eukaryotic-like serine/threonine-protein kinase